MTSPCDSTSSGLLLLHGTSKIDYPSNQTDISYDLFRLHEQYSPKILQQIKLASVELASYVAGKLY